MTSLKCKLGEWFYADSFGVQSIIMQMMTLRENGNYQDLVGRTGESVSLQSVWTWWVVYRHQSSRGTGLKGNSPFLLPQNLTFHNHHTHSGNSNVTVWHTVLDVDSHTVGELIHVWFLNFLKRDCFTEWHCHRLTCLFVLIGFVSTQKNTTKNVTFQDESNCLSSQSWKI